MADLRGPVMAQHAGSTLQGRRAQLDRCYRRRALPVADRSCHRSPGEEAGGEERGRSFFADGGSGRRPA